MVLSLRFACTLRAAAARSTSHRSLTSSAIVREEANVQTQRKPVGGIRGGYVLLSAKCAWKFRHYIYRIFGFLLGFSLASSYAAYHLLDEYQKASATLQASVEELKLSTEKVGTHMHSLTIESGSQHSYSIQGFCSRQANWGSREGPQGVRWSFGLKRWYCSRKSWGKETVWRTTYWLVFYHLSVTAAFCSEILTIEFLDLRAYVWGIRESNFDYSRPEFWYDACRTRPAWSLKKGSDRGPYIDFLWLFHTIVLVAMPLRIYQMVSLHTIIEL